MRMPFERLMEEVNALSAADSTLPIGVLSERWGEPSLRIMDAVDAVRVLKGEQTYIRLDAG